MPVQSVFPEIPAWDRLAFLVFGYYTMICFVMFFTIRHMEELWSNKGIPTSKHTKALIVIAHPDDEVMFFGPTILNLLKTGSLYILCLSDGNHEGLGRIRRYELLDSCDTLGIPLENVTIMKHDKLKDGPHDWPLAHLSTVIYNHVQAYGIDTVVTFDGYGVSGHKNHISIYKAVASLKEKGRLPYYIRCYALISSSVITKYFFGVYLLPFFYFFSDCVFVAGGTSHILIKEAMLCHRSQYVWYRKLYMYASRYVVINTLKDIPHCQAQQTSGGGDIGEPSPARTHPVKLD